MKIIKVMLQKTMLINFLLGISSGLPLALVGKTLQAWFTDADLGLSIVGLFSLVGLPYSLKFLWAPVFDRFTLPLLGRRRGWLLVTQLALAGAIVFLALTPPNGDLPLSARLPEGIVSFLAWLNAKLPDSLLSFTIIFACFLVSFCSASQDIVVDAYRRESLKDEELGLGSTVYVYGYRVAMYLSGGAVFFIADLISWPMVYITCAALLGLGVIATLWADEPEVHGALPRTFKESVVLPLQEFFSRDGVSAALVILVFVLLYKVGDTMAGNVTINFYKEYMGFTNAQIGAIAKTWGLLAALVGGFLGGAVILKIGIKRALMLGGILQAASTAGFSLVARMFANYQPVGDVAFAATPQGEVALASVIAFEDITGAMGTAAFVAFMAAQTNKRFTATQYALLTSLMSVPRIVISAPAGILAERIGWQPFFLFCVVAAVPGLLLLVYMLNSKKFSTLS